MAAEKVAPLGWENLVDKAMNKAGNVFEAVSTLLNNAVTEYGPHAVDAVLWVIRIDHIQKLVGGFVVLIAAIVYWTIFIKKLRNHIGANNHKGLFDADESYIVGGMVGLLVTVLFVAPLTYFSVFNVWNYVAVAKPELWIAKQVVVKIEKWRTSK